MIQTLVPKYSLGSQLQKVIGIEKINFEEDDSITKEDSSFSAENGIVYLVDVWVYYISKLGNLVWTMLSTNGSQLEVA